MKIGWRNYGKFLERFSSKMFASKFEQLYNTSSSSNSKRFNVTRDSIIKSVYACNCKKRRPRKFFRPPKFIPLSYLQENCTQMDGLIHESLN